MFCIVLRIKILNHPVGGKKTIIAYIGYIHNIIFFFSFITLYDEMNHPHTKLSMKNKKHSENADTSTSVTFDL